MNKFDRILWRINGVLFLAILALGFLPLVWQTVEFSVHRPSHHDGPTILNQAHGTHEEERFQLGGPSRITGTSILRMPLYGEATSREYSSFKSGGDHSHTRNYLFVDYSDLSSWWLFKTFDRAIVKEHDFRVGTEGKDRRVISTIFETATKDTNGDQKVTEGDHIAAFLAAADGKKPIEIISDSDRILSVDQVTDNQVLIVYQRGSAVTATLISAQDGSKIKESLLPTGK